MINLILSVKLSNVSRNIAEAKLIDDFSFICPTRISLWKENAFENNIL